jgi:hypothetical protein
MKSRATRRQQACSARTGRGHKVGAKKIRDDENYRQRVDTCIASHSQARFSHGICLSCFETVVRPLVEQLHTAKR